MVRLFLSYLLLIPVGMLAQTTSFGPVEKLPSTINTEYEESTPHLSPDGTTLYFTRLLSPENTGGKYSGADIWASRYDVTILQWGKADNRKMEVNSSGNNAVIGTNRKGDVIYFLRTSSSKQVSGIYFSRKIESSWTRPELIPITGISSQGFLGIYISPDADVIFLSLKGEDSRGEEDLYVSVKNSTGGWSIPKNLGPTINTPGFEISPFLSPDKKKLYFSSNGHEGEGDGDVFYADRLYDSWETWSVPKNLGPEINSKAFEGYFSIYGDTVAYFASNRGSKLSDLYRSKVKVTQPTYLMLDKPNKVEEPLVTISKDTTTSLTSLTDEELVKVFGFKVDLNIKFDNSSFALRSDSRELLFFIVNKISAHKDLTVKLFGHSDNAGSEVYNLELARRRATTIRDFLIENGLGNHALSSQGVSGGTSGVVEILLYRK